MLKPGMVVGQRYRLCHLIAEGGMAEIYLANDLNPEGAQYVALKRLLPELATNNQHVELFKQEAELSAKIQHENVIGSKDFFCDSFGYFLVLEYLCGKDFKEISYSLDNSPLKFRVEFVASAALLLCRALKALVIFDELKKKTQSVVHCDISPQNIMLDLNGNLKLIDFGVARPVEGEKFSSSAQEFLHGKIKYMSPEQNFGSAIDQRSDMYSTSLVLLELLVGKKIFEKILHEDQNKKKFFTINFENFFREQNAIELLKILQKNLHSDPNKRFDSPLMWEKNLQEFFLKNNFESAQNFLKKFILSLDSPQKKNKRKKNSWIFNFELRSVFFGLVLVVVICAYVISLLTIKPTINKFPAEKFVQSNHVIAPKKNAFQTNSQQKKFGKLSITVRPWAEVYVRDKYYGDTPMESLDLKEGEYVVQLRNPELSKFVLKIVTIFPEKKTEIFHDFNTQEDS